MKAPASGATASEVWARLEPAKPDHPYIAAKSGLPDGLRVVPNGDPLRIAGQSVAGWLAVPMMPLTGGEPVSLQFIPPPGTGKKLNLPGHPVAGVFVVGTVEQAGTVFVVEGIGQAWAAWKATGRAAVVAFGWGRLRAVAAELRQRDASARVVLVPDAGKQGDAERIARELACEFVPMPEGWPPNSDVSDLGLRDGFDAVERLLSNPRTPEPPAPRYRLLTADDIRNLPPLAWRVRGVLPAQGLGSVYGPSSSGKSFLALDLAAAIAEGEPFFGYSVKPAPVVYVALEGEAGFRLRVAAWEKANGRPLPAGLRLALQPFRLTEREDVADLADAAVSAAGTGGVTILDTLNRAAPGVDENSPEGMGAIIEGAAQLQRATGGLVLLLHHRGKDPTRGMRGHSSLHAALDAAIEVDREGERREWKLAKEKDGPDGESHPFRLHSVDLGTDDEGEPVSSCVVRPDESPQDATRPRLPKGGNQRIVFDALGELLTKSRDFGKAGAPLVRPCVELEPTVEAIAPRLTCEAKRQKERVRQALTGLIASRVVTCREGWMWLP